MSPLHDSNQTWQPLLVPSKSASSVDHKDALHKQVCMHCRGLDFDDLLSWPVALLQQCSEVRARMQKRYKHILVDEFQDTNAPQYELVRMLAGSQVSPAIFAPVSPLCILSHHYTGMLAFVSLLHLALQTMVVQACWPLFHHLAFQASATSIPGFLLLLCAAMIQVKLPLFLVLFQPLCITGRHGTGMLTSVLSMLHSSSTASLCRAERFGKQSCQPISMQQKHLRGMHRLAILVRVSADNQGQNLQR